MTLFSEEVQCSTSTDLEDQSLFELEGSLGSVLELYSSSLRASTILRVSPEDLYIPEKFIRENWNRPVDPSGINLLFGMIGEGSTEISPHSTYFSIPLQYRLETISISHKFDLSHTLLLRFIRRIAHSRSCNLRQFRFHCTNEDGTITFLLLNLDC